MRYIENAKNTLELAGRDGKFYIDEKYVHTACGTAYIGMLKALDYYFELKNVPKKRGRKAIEYYRTVLSDLDKKLYSFYSFKHQNYLFLSATKCQSKNGYFLAPPKIYSLN